MDIKRQFSVNDLNSLAELGQTRPLSEHHFIFDLDSTIFDVTPRTRAIFADYCKLQKDQRLDSVQFMHSDWGIREAFLRAGILLTDSLFKDFHKVWRKDFFSSEYLHHDEPYPASIDFIKEAGSAGIEVSYLTGRDAEHMLEGTVTCLNRFSLPLSNEGSNLFMKPKKAWGEDEEFKARKLRELLVKSAKQIVFFENEPIIIQEVLRMTPQVLVVYTDTVHSGKSEISDGVYKLRSWEHELAALRSSLQS